MGLRTSVRRCLCSFTQYSHAWFDFGNRRDAYTDYFQNSIIATKVHRLFCLKLQDRFSQFSEELWGITSSDSVKGYVGWGGPPESGPLDGTMVPRAAAGSLPFLPRECVRTLEVMRKRFGNAVWKRYGFVDAFNPHTGWFNPDVVGIDAGISVLMAENAQSGFVWRTQPSVTLKRAALSGSPAAQIGFEPWDLFAVGRVHLQPRPSKRMAA